MDSGVGSGDQQVVSQMIELNAGQWTSIVATPGLSVEKLLALRHGVPVVLDPFFGWLSLYDGALVSRLQVPRASAQGVAVSPNGGRIAYGTGKRMELVIASTAEVLPAAGSRAFEVPICFGPDGILFTGARHQYKWILDGPKPKVLAYSPAEEVPCTHLRKAPGSTTNSFRRIEVDLREGFAMSVADCDVVISRDVPQAVREQGADMEKVENERVLLYQTSDRLADKLQVGQLHGAEADSLRLDHAIVVLGPTLEERYVVGLDVPTVRVVNGRGEVLPRLEGYAVYDHQHRERRRGKGRLLAGTGEWITGLEANRLFRENVVTGARRDLGPEVRHVADALPLRGTSNVVLLARRDGSSAPIELRLV